MRLQATKAPQSLNAPPAPAPHRHPPPVPSRRHVLRSGWAAFFCTFASSAGYSGRWRTASRSGSFASRSDCGAVADGEVELLERRRGIPPSARRQARL